MSYKKFDKNIKKETLKQEISHQFEIKEALKEKGFWNPYDVFNHAPEFYPSDDSRYHCEIRIVKWNTKSTRMTVLMARYDNKKQKWVFAPRRGQKRQAHGEKMR